jgi:hypothetical protein
MGNFFGGVLCGVFIFAPLTYGFVVLVIGGPLGDLFRMMVGRDPPDG